MHMSLRGVYKSAKLVRVALDIEGDRIKSIRITGDFFMYPEEAIRRLEKCLVGAKLDEQELLRLVREFFEREKVIVPLMQPSDFVKAIMRALEKGDL